MPLVVIVYWARLPVKMATSVPVPPSMVSLPPWPVMVSLPPPPLMVSLPLPPKKNSLPEPPVMVSLKFEPWTELTPPVMVSMPIAASSAAAMPWAVPTDRSTVTAAAA